MKPKCLYIAHSYFNRAGTEAHMKNLAHELREEYEVFIVFPDKGFVCLIGPDEILHRFEGMEPVWPRTPYRLEVMNRSLAAVLERVRPDFVHIQHFLNWPLSIIDQIADTGIPFAITLHDYYAITPYYTLEDVRDPSECFTLDYSLRVFKTDITHYLIERQKVLAKSLARANAIIAPSNFLASTCKKIFPGEYRVIEHGIRPFEPLPKVRADNANCVFGYMGGLIPQKGWDFLLEAFNILHLTAPKNELHFFGGHNQSGMTWPGVHFHGIYEKEQLPEICASIDVGVIPSAVPETFCLVLSEFWQSKTPVAVAAIGALNERVRDNENGRKFRAKSVIDIVNTMRWFTENTSWKNWTYPAPKLLHAMIDDYRKFYRELRN
jgi:glycosyltransferase involved in cell wall biosynthesis